MIHHRIVQSLLWIAAVPGTVLAQSAEPVPAVSLSANVALTSNYKFRGQDQDVLGHRGEPKTSWFKPAIQGGFDLVFGESGFYLGNWNSSVNWLPGNSIESDLYGGYKFKGGPFDFDVGTLGYLYAGNSAGNTWEIYGAASYTHETLGAFTLKYSHTVSNDYFNYAGHSGGSGLKGTNTGYLNLAYAKEIVPKLMLKAGLGYTFMSSDIRSLGYRNYADYSLGLAYDFGNGLSLGGAVQGATRESSYAVHYGLLGEQSFSPNKARFVVALSKTL